MKVDLAPTTGDAIVRKNLRAAQAIHTAFMLDALCMYQVVDRVIDLFKQGQLPIARGPVVRALSNYAFDSTRLTEAERRNVYARVFGAPGGDAGAPGPNRDFEKLWLRFVAAVADHARGASAETLLRPRSAANAGVRRAAQALSDNLSQHCTGAAFAAAPALQHASDAQMQLLRDPQLMQALGARDLWQVIDSVNRLHLGGAVNAARLGLLSRTAATIIAWLAAGADGPGSSLSDSTGPDEPTNDELVVAVTHWLVCAGTSAAAVLHDARTDDALVSPDGDARRTTRTRRGNSPP